MRECVRLVENMILWSGLLPTSELMPVVMALLSERLAPAAQALMQVVQDCNGVVKEIITKAGALVPEDWRALGAFEAIAAPFEALQFIVKHSIPFVDSVHAAVS